MEEKHPSANAKLRSLVEGALREHESALVHYVAGLLRGDWERARDVVQDAFLKMCRQDADALDGTEKAWLYTVCRNGAYDRLRQTMRRREESGDWDSLREPGPDPAESLARSDSAREVWQAVASLPAKKRETILLRFQQDMSYREIAEITGQPEGTVAYQIHESLNQLRRTLGSRKEGSDKIFNTPKS